MKRKTVLYSIISTLVASAILVTSSIFDINVEEAQAEPAIKVIIVSGSGGLLPEGIGK